MDSPVIVMTFAAGALAYALIRNARAYAEARRREAEFFARHLRVRPPEPIRLRLVTGP